MASRGRASTALTATATADGSRQGKTTRTVRRSAVTTARSQRAPGRNCNHQRGKWEKYYDEQGASTSRATSSRASTASGRAGIYWTGGSYGNTLDNLRNGYRAPEFIHSAAYVPMSPRKRPTWNEEPEGDLDIGRLYGGYDTAYLVPSEQEKKPGLRVMIEFAFAAGVAKSRPSSSTARGWPDCWARWSPLATT